MALVSDWNMAYNQRARSAQQQRDAQLAQNAYSRFLSRQRGRRDLADLNRGMSAGVQGLAAGFARRGLRNSGIYGEAQNAYAQNWARQDQAIRDQRRQSIQGLNLSDAQAWANYDDLLAELGLQKNMSILQTAATLDSIRPFLGS